MEKFLSTDTYDKIHFLLFRALIINYDGIYIASLHDDFEKYIQMLDTIDFSIYHDSNFFLLKDYAMKTLTFIKECSIKFNTKGKVRDIENEIIGDLNQLKTIGDKDLRIRDFYELERNLRMNLPYDDDDIIGSISCDYGVIRELLVSSLNDKKIKNISCRQFVESTSFFLDSIPEFYEECPDAIEMSINYLDTMPKVHYLKLNRGIKKIKKRLKTYE